MRSRTTATFFAAVLASLLGAPPAGAQLVSVRFAGLVTVVDSGCDEPWGSVAIGDPWTAVFTYDTQAADSNPGDPSRGFYVDAVTDFSIEVGPAAFSGVPGFGGINVFDGVPSGIDQLEVTVDPTPGSTDLGFFLQLDGNEPLLPSEALPLDCSLLAPGRFDLATDMAIDDNDLLSCRIEGQIHDFTCGGKGTSYQCYRAKDRKDPKFAKITGVALSDAIADTESDLKKLFQVCLPVDRDGEGIDDPLNALCCYKQKAPKPKPAPEVRTEDDLGGLAVQLKKPDTLCLPCVTRPPTPAP